MFPLSNFGLQNNALVLSAVCVLCPFCDAKMLSAGGCGDQRGDGFGLTMECKFH